MAWLLRALVFLLPTQVGIHFWPDFSHVFGIRVDYLSPTVYLTDILLLVFVMLFFRNAKLSSYTVFFRKHLAVIFSLTVFITINILHATNPLASAVKWIKVFELLLFAYVIAKVKINFYRDIIVPLTLSLVFFSLVGLLQFFVQRSLGGIFYFLGERTHSSETVGIALSSLGGRSVLRAYSTFSHPNSFVGYYLVATFLVLFQPSRQSKMTLFKIFTCVGLVLVLLITFSLSAYLTALAIMFLSIVVKAKVHKRICIYALYLLVGISLLSPIISQLIVNGGNFSREVVERLWLNIAVGEMLSRSPIFGVGLNNFVVNLPTTNIPNSIIWSLQPVHNIFLLVLVEAGLLGLLVFSYVILKAIRRLLFTNYYLLITIFLFLLLGMADHYWLTLQQNQLLFALVLGLSFRRLRSIS